MNKLILLFLLILVGCTQYDYEVCDNKINGECKIINIFDVAQPSAETTEICYQGKCENVPNNRLLFKGGTDMTIDCFKDEITLINNYWNSEGIINNCEMPVNSTMSFLYKQHDQSIRSHTGTIQIKIDVVNFKNDYKSLQIFTGEDNNNDNLPDFWVYCGNVNKINGRTTKIIRCNGTNLKFVNLKNAQWNEGSLFIDNIEVLKN